MILLSFFAVDISSEFPVGMFAFIFLSALFLYSHQIHSQNTTVAAVCIHMHSIPPHPVIRFISLMPKLELQIIGWEVYDSLKEGPKTVSEISWEENICWTTVNNHLEYMVMLGKVSGVRSRNITIWEIV